MGMGFKLNLKWGLPNQCPPITNSLFRCSPSVLRGREASFDLARVSSLSVISEDGETVYKDPSKIYNSSSTQLQTLENDFSELDEMKMNVGKRSCNDSQKLMDDSHMPIGEDKSAFQPFSAARFSLLLKNLDILEEIIADSDTVKLERDILVQLGRLGALKIFHECLARTLNAPSLSDLSDACIADSPIQDPLDPQSVTFVRSGKKEKRKSRRERALEKANIFARSLPSKIICKSPRQPSVDSVKRHSNSRSRRLTVARNEVEMSKGVKAVADFERIRTTMEEETGTVATLSNWAEAARVDKKVLQQHLRFGWYCRDGLLRSSRSLVFFLARNYRGLGVAFEDIIQAGNLGVLQGAERFDPSKGYRFSTYVQYWIRKSMSMLVTRHSSGIKKPFAVSRAINQVQKARKTLRKSHGKYPVDDKIAEITGLSLAQVRSARNCPRIVGSIDKKIGDLSCVKFLECTADASIKSPDESVMWEHLQKDINDLLNSLNPRERQVLILRYGLGNYQRKSLQEIGKLFQVSKERVRKIEKAAMTKLREKEILCNLSHYVNLYF